MLLCPLFDSIITDNQNTHSPDTVPDKKPQPQQIYDQRLG